MKYTNFFLKILIFWLGHCWSARAREPLSKQLSIQNPSSSHGKSYPWESLLFLTLALITAKASRGVKRRAVQETNDDPRHQQNVLTVQLRPINLCCRCHQHPQTRRVRARPRKGCEQEPAPLAFPSLYEGCSIKSNVKELWNFCKISTHLIQFYVRKKWHFVYTLWAFFFELWPLFLTKYRGMNLAGSAKMVPRQPSPLASSPPLDHVLLWRLVVTRARECDWLASLTCDAL